MGARDIIAPVVCWLCRRLGKRQCPDYMILLEAHKTLLIAAHLGNWGESGVALVNKITDALETVEPGAGKEVRWTANKWKG